MKVLELFSGIGACSKALERLDIEHELVDSVEIDKYAVKSFNAIHCTNFEPQDITTWDKQLDVDLIIGGFPCQDISLAGKQAGIIKGETRSGLMYEMLRIINKLKPKYVIAENVKNLLSKKFRDTFEMILRDLEEAGYNNYWQVLNARDYGVPQNRERVFIVSIRKDVDQSFKFPDKEVLKVKLKDLLEENVDEKFYLSDRLIKCFSDTTDRNGYVRGKRFNPHDLTKEYAFTITTSAGNRATDNYIKVPEATKKGYAEARDGDGIYINRPHQKRGCVQKGKVPTIKANPCDLGVVVENKIILEEPLIRDGWHKRNKQVINPEGISSCVVAQSNNSLQKVAVEENFITKKYNKFITENGYIPEKFNPYNEKEIVEIAPTQSTCCGSATSSSAVLVKEATKKGYVEAKEGDSINLEQPNSQTRRGRVGKQVAQTLTTSCNQGVVGIIVKNQGKEIKRTTEIASTLMARDYKGFGNQEMTGVLSDLKIRKLTPLECWRLMGFDDEDFYKAAKVNSNSRLYQQAGNSIVVQVLEAIFKNLFLGGNNE